MKTVTRVEQHQIRRNHPLFPALDDLGLRSKNLYNATLYKLRQIHFHNEKVWKEGKGKQKELLSCGAYSKKRSTKSSEAFLDLPAKVSQATVKRAFDDFLYFYKALKAWSKTSEKFKAKPKPPNYKHPEHGRQLLTYNNQAISKSWREGVLKLSGQEWTIPFRAHKWASKLSEVRVVHRQDYYVIEIVYQVDVDMVAGRKVCAIDPGLNNLATVAFTHRKALIVPGGPVKAINAFYNRLIAQAKSNLPEGVRTSRHIKSLWRNRHNKIKDYFHKSTTQLINTLYEEGIGCIVIGHNEGQKQRINLGRRTNRDFVQVPRTMFNTMLQYKAEDRGMVVVLTEESYTSKASALDRDKLPAKRGGQHQFSGKRVKRGLYRTKDKSLINADVNGAYNIMRKIFPQVIRKGWWSDRIKGFVVTPERLSPTFGW